MTSETPLSARQKGRYGLLMGLRWMARRLYDFDFQWIDKPDPKAWTEVRLVLVLHHTSLLEPLFVGGVPPAFLRHWARNGVAPVAQKTMKRLLVGTTFDALIPEPISVTRKSDHTWKHFLKRATLPGRVVVLFPEGRMKRKTGLDKHGDPLSVRGGVADVLKRMDEGKMMIAYSGGLHHVQAPGETIIRPFKTLRMNLESLSIPEYRQQCQQSGQPFKKAVVEDLEQQKEKYCPTDDERPASEIIS